MSASFRSATLAERGETVPQEDIEPMEKPDFCREEEEREAEQKGDDTESGGRGAV